MGNWGFEEHCYVHGLGIAAQCETIEEALWLVVLRSLVVVVVRGVVRGVQYSGHSDLSLAICTSGHLDFWIFGTSDHLDFWTSSHLDF